MHPDNEIKIPETTEIKVKPLSHATFSGDGAQSVTYTQGKGSQLTVDDIMDAVSQSSLMEQVKSTYEEELKRKLNAIYGRRIEEKHEEEEWIWVDGYKGTESDMTASQNFQYKLGELYAMDEDVKIEACKSGFHFCRDLKDVFEYYDIKKGNRFFKVHALVRKKDYEEYGTVVRKTGVFGSSMKQRIDKLAAKKIILEHELTLDEIFFEDKYADWTEGEKKLALAKGCRAVYCNRMAKELVEAGYSEPFAKYISESESMTKKALAVASQPGLSMDMKVFAIMYND